MRMTGGILGILSSPCAAADRVARQEPPRRAGAGRFDLIHKLITGAAALATLVKLLLG